MPGAARPVPRRPAVARRGARATRRSPPQLRPARWTGRRRSAADISRAPPRSLTMVRRTAAAAIDKSDGPVEMAVLPRGVASELGVGDRLPEAGERERSEVERRLAVDDPRGDRVSDRGRDGEAGDVAAARDEEAFRAGR